jgi:hypothetical protein
VACCSCLAIPQSSVGKVNGQIYFLRGNFDIFFLYSTLLHLPPSEEDAAFEPRTFATLALALTTRLDLIFADSLDLILGEIWWRKICKFVQPMGSKDLLP